MEKPFYMNFMEGGKAPAIKHATREQAELEAQRICEVYGNKVYTLAVISSVEKAPRFIHKKFAE